MRRLRRTWFLAADARGRMSRTGGQQLRGNLRRSASACQEPVSHLRFDHSDSGFHLHHPLTMAANSFASKACKVCVLTLP